MQKVIFHIPHDGANKPDELMKSVCISQERFEFYQEKMQDNDVRRFVPPECDKICFEISRLLCDVERFIGKNEPMEKHGMGYCYQKAYDGTVIKTVTQELREQTMRYYKEHHRRMDNLAEKYRDGLFLIDLHSFSNDIIVGNGNKTLYADICLGYEDKYCNPC